MTRPLRSPRPEGEETRAKILDFIIRYKSKKKISPTIREITEGVGLASTSMTSHHLKRLEREGVIILIPKIARGIVLPPEPIAEVEYRCHYPFGCSYRSSRPGECRFHGTKLVPFITRKKAE
jgi:SOS-response transcriptional repressor LexA